MQLAVNYTPQAANLLPTIHCDLFKCPDWPDVIAEAQQHRPVYVHFPLHTSQRAMQAVNWTHIDHLMSITDTRYLNVHIAPNAHDFAEMPIDTTDPDWTAQIIEAVLKDIAVFTARYGVECVILENAPWDTNPKYAIPRPAIDPHVIAQIVHESGCGLLLDTAHARIAALHLGMDERAYLDAMPGEVLREMHVTGTKYDEGAWIDHFAMTDPDWALAEYALSKIKNGLWVQPDIIALEYGGVGPLFEWRSESQVIQADMQRLFTLIRRSSL